MIFSQCLGVFKVILALAPISTWATPIDIEVSNHTYNFPTRLYISSQYKNDMREEIIFDIPPLQESSQPLRKTLVAEKIQEVYCVLTQNKTQNEDELDSTALAIKNFRPAISVIQSVKIELTDKGLRIIPTYHLPPKFID